MLAKKVSASDELQLAAFDLPALAAKFGTPSERFRQDFVPREDHLRQCRFVGRANQSAVGDWKAEQSP